MAEARGGAENDARRRASQPLELLRTEVRPEWIDYNGHMNVAYYLLAFDHGIEELLDAIGIDERYVKERQASTFTLELHVNYEAEVRAGDPLLIRAQLLDFDAKRIHVFLEMDHAEQGFRAATSEMILMHIDMRERRAAPFPADVHARIEAIHDAHRGLATPSNMGRVIGIRRR